MNFCATAFSLRNLNNILPATTASRLMKKYGTVSMAVWCARVEYYESLLGRQPKEGGMSSLIEALLAGGYIRKDITPATFAIGRLYKKAAEHRKIECYIPTGVADLYRENAEEANRRYEQFVAPTQEQCDRLIEYVRVFFHDKSDKHPRQSKAENIDRNVDIVRYWCGLGGDGMPHATTDIGRRYGLSRHAVIYIVGLIVHRLAFHPFAIEGDDDITAAIFAVEELRPRHSLRAVVDDWQVYNALRRAGINTVGDALELFNPESKKRVRNLGTKGKDWLRECLRKAGYTFSKDGYLATEADFEVDDFLAEEVLEVIPEE